jgi:hypothetical protein
LRRSKRRGRTGVEDKVTKQDEEEGEEGGGPCWKLSGSFPDWVPPSPCPKGGGRGEEEQEEEQEEIEEEEGEENEEERGIRIKWRKRRRRRRKRKRRRSRGRRRRRRWERRWTLLEAFRKLSGLGPSEALSI